MISITTYGLAQHDFLKDHPACYSAVWDPGLARGTIQFASSRDCFMALSERFPPVKLGPSPTLNDESPAEDVGNALQILVARRAELPFGTIQCVPLTLMEYEGITKRLTAALQKLRSAP